MNCLKTSSKINFLRRLRFSPFVRALYMERRTSCSRPFMMWKAMFLILIISTILMIYMSRNFLLAALGYSLCGCSDQSPRCMACNLRISETQYCASNPRLFDCLPERKKCCDQLKRTCSNCQYDVETEIGFCGNMSRHFDCYGLPVKCLACSKNLSEEEFCRNYPGLDGCGGTKRGDIMIGIYVIEKEGYTEFSTSVIKKHHDISSEDIHLFRNGTAVLNDTALRSWYGDEIRLHDGNAGIFIKALETFVSTEYKVLFLIDSETVFLKRWREVVSENMIRSKVIFLSLYHSSNMHDYTNDCIKYNGEVCEGTVRGEFGVAISKELAQISLEKYKKNLVRPDWNSLLIKENVRRLYTRNSVVMKIGQSSQGSDNCGENEVPHRFNLCEFPTWIRNGIEFYFDRCTSGDENFLPDFTIPLIEKQERLWVRPAISYSLYGSKTRYTNGALENVARVFSIYPGWKIWIYTDGSVPSNITDRLCEYNVRFIDMSQTLIKNKMSWRFLVASAPVKMYAIRDIDARLLERGKAAVDDWIKSGRTFHVLRDHPNHSKFPMNGGMWGGLGKSLPDMRELIIMDDKKDAFMLDMDFLNGKIWERVNKSVWVHDAYSLHKFGEDHPFPTKRRKNGEFIGDVNFQ